MRTMLVAAVLTVACAPGFALADSPFDGTWKENIASSKISKADITLLKDGMYSCKTCVPEYTVKADGADQPVSGNPYYDTISVNASDEHNVVLTEKKNGKTVETITFKIAPDGKSFAAEFSGTSENGTAFSGAGGANRIAAGPSGSQPLSGSWARTELKNASDSLTTVTYKTDGDMLTMTDPGGESFTAKMDGAEAPVKGNPGVTTVMVKKSGARTLVETDMRDGKVVDVRTKTVSMDGKSMTVVDSHKLSHRTTTYTAEKQ